MVYERCMQRIPRKFEFMRMETTGSVDCNKDVRVILSALIQKPVQLLYSATGRTSNGVGKKNFSATTTWSFLRVDLIIQRFCAHFLKSKYNKSDKELINHHRNEYLPLRCR